MKVWITMWILNNICIMQINELLWLFILFYFIFWPLWLQHKINNREVQKGMFWSLKREHYHRNQCSGNHMHFYFYWTEKLIVVYIFPDQREKILKQVIGKLTYEIVWIGSVLIVIGRILLMVFFVHALIIFNTHFF